MMDIPIRSWYLRYSSAIIGVVAAWFIRGVLDGVLGDRFSFGVFYVAILLVAARDGLGPGLLTLTLSGLISAYFFIPPRPYLAIEGLDSQLSLALYLMVGVVIVSVGHGLRAARRRAETLALEARKGRRQLEQRLAEQQRAEVALRASERLLWLALDAAGMCAWRWDLRSGEIVLSDSARQLMGVARTRISNVERAFDVIHPEDVHRHRANIEDAIARRGGYVSEFRLIRPDDGKAIWIEDRARVEHDEEGTPIALLGIAMDITARKRAEMHNALLADLGAQIRPGQDAEDTLYRVVGLLGKRLGVSRVLFGDVDDEKSLITIHHDYTDGLPSIAGVRPLVEDELVRAEARQGKVRCCRDVSTDPRIAPHTSELWLIGVAAFLAVPLVRDGVWVATLALQDARPRDWTPDEVDLVKIVAERTWLAVENQRLSAETRRSEEQFRVMADTVPDILFIGRPDATIEYASRRLYDYTGLGPGEVLGHGWKVTVHPDDLPAMGAELDRRLGIDEPFEQEFRLRAKGGVYRWFVSRSSPVMGPDGRVSRWFGTLTDIEDRKRAEEEMHEEARRKDEFLATLAHELRNPLAPILNAVHILKAMGPAGERVGWARDVIERQVEQMSRLVDDLLDVSRITRGKIELHRQRLDIRAVMDSAVETSRPKIDAAGHELAIDLPPAPLCVDGDPTRLAQVLTNLLNNAASYTEPGGHIWLSATREGDDVVVRVRDSGIGIPAQKLPHIFDMFIQAHVPQPRAQRSLGIGLTLVKRLVEMHGGSVEACSDGPGKGSEFTVRLPVVTPEEQAKPTASEQDTGAAPGSRRRILVVDDNEDSAQSLAMFLDMLGNEVRVAYSGRQALEEAVAAVPDVVLLDIGLPDTSGYEVARAMRREPALEHAVLIAQTGWGQEEDRRRSREAGFDHHLVKPIDLDRLQELLTDIEALIGGR